MRASLQSTALAALAAAACLTAAPQQAQAQTYPIDCAILLCLSGGWPASVPCTRARAEFIRRITPWPVEPPLQIWRCPMGASFEVDPDSMFTDRIWDAVFEDIERPLQSYPSAPLGNDSPVLEPQPAVLRYDVAGTAMPLPKGFSHQSAQGHINQDGKSDIDISGAEFNFVRSIRVYMIHGYQSEGGRDGDEECRRTSSVRLGTYGTQGDYRWDKSSVSAIPTAHVGLERYGRDCPEVSNRSVFIDWRDYEGNYGYEQVHY
ncbi:MAG: hypothetical protein WBA25_00845 [Jannaschia sp.]